MGVHNTIVALLLRVSYMENHPLPKCTCDIRTCPWMQKGCIERIYTNMEWMSIAPCAIKRVVTHGKDLYEHRMNVKCIECHQMNIMHASIMGHIHHIGLRKVYSIGWKGS
jgi:hypothetical protein